MRFNLYIIFLAVFGIYTVWNFFSLIFFTAFDANLTALLIVKDFVLVGFLILPILVVARQLRFSIGKDVRVVFFAILVYAAIVSVLCLYSSAPPLKIIFNYRRILLLFSFVALMMVVDAPKNIFAYWERFLRGIFWVVLLFGFFEIAVGDWLWEEWLPIIPFWDANAVDPVSIRDIKEVGRLYTSDLLFLSGEKHRRMISLILEPTLLGSFFSFVFCYFFVLKKNATIVLLSFVGGLLCFSKLFIISVVFVLLVAPFFRLTFWLVSAGVLLSMCVGFVVHTYFGLIHGSLSHLIGLYTGVELAVQNPFGLGVGVGGNRGELNFAIVNGQLGGESGAGNVFAQIGIFGFIHLFIIVKMISVSDWFYRRSGDLTFRATSVCIAVYLINFLFSASSLGTSVHIIYFGLFCFAVKRMKFLEKRIGDVCVDKVGS